MAEPSTSLDTLLGELAEAAKIYDAEAAHEVCDRMIAGLNARPDPVDEATGRMALGQLRQMRAFAEMERLGDAFLRTGQDAPQIVRQYAQALIENGALAAAVAVLQKLAAREPLGSEEGDEARGLLGRAYKQIYLDARNPRASGADHALRQSVAAYLQVYDNDPERRLWHGQNAAELLWRAARDGIEVEGPDPRELARTILDRITEADLAGTATKWDYGSARQVAMVLGEGDVAREWLKKRLEARPDAFSLASAVRQLEELWEITEEDPQWGGMLAVLKSHMMEAGGGQSVVVDHLPPPPEAFEQHSGGFEKTFGSAGAVTVKWWALAQERLKSIARIDDKVGTAIGTAFAVKGSDLNPEWGDGCVMITNAHVVSSPPQLKAIEPDKAVANFTLLAGQEPIPVTELLFQSGPYELDVAVLRLESMPDDVPPVPLARNLPLADGEQRLYVMGHPAGGDLKISIDDNVLIDRDEVRLHYKAPTEPGSSGSPVFNREWELIALHHKGNDNMERLNDKKGTYQANEGISFKAIREACAAPPAAG